MRNKIVIILMMLVATQLPGAEGEHGAENAKPFSLEVKDKRVILVNGDMCVAVGPGNMNPGFAGAFGNFNGYGLNIPPETITVDKDTDLEKRVALVAQDGKCRITLTLSAVKTVPAIEINAAKQNMSEYTVLRHFYYRLVGFKFPYYYDVNGWQYAGVPQLPASKWMFLPSANTNGGYGLIPLHLENSKITTLWPRADWQEVGPYFAPEGPRMLQPEETARVGFKIFPAISQYQVATSIMDK